jgi:hypothetical protein
MNNLIFPKDANFYYSFAIKHKEALMGENGITIDGWKIYDPVKEYIRQGIRFEDVEYN